MKKIVISFILFALTSNIAYASAMLDVDSNHIYIDSIKYLYSQDIVSGYSDNTFRPENSITRGEFTKIIIEAVYEDADPDLCTASENPNDAYSATTYSYKTKDFPDVSRSDTFGGYICIAKAEKIIGGYSDGNFKPNEYVTVGQASKITAIAMDLIDQETVNRGEFDKFKIFIGALAELNALPETMGGIDEPIKRGEMAEIIYRIKKAITNKTSKGYSEYY